MSQRDFPEEPFVAHASAVALCGRIDQVQPDEGADPAPVGANIAIEGGSCSLGSLGGRSVSRARGRDTTVAGHRIVSFQEAEAETWDEVRINDKGRPVRHTYTRTSIRGLEIGGFLDMPLLRLEHGELVVKSTHCVGEVVRFSLEACRLTNLVVGGKRFPLEPLMRGAHCSTGEWHPREMLRNKSFGEIGKIGGIEPTPPTSPPGSGPAPEKLHLLLARVDPRSGWQPHRFGAQPPQPQDKKEEKREDKKPDEKAASAATAAGRKLPRDDGGWYYVPKFGFLRVADFEVTSEAYQATLLKFHLGCKSKGSGSAGQNSGNGTIDPHG
jgi:hypothetical protein